MEGGAWNSGVFETGRDGQSKTRVPTAQARPGAMEAGTPPAWYNPLPKEANRESWTVGVMTVALRSLLVVFTLITVGVMAASKQNTDTYTVTTDEVWFMISSTFSVKFTEVPAFVGLLSVAIIVLFYSMVQLVLCLVHVLTTGSFITPATGGDSLLTFIFDSVLAYALIAAAAAAADAQSVVKEQEVCKTFSKFCGTVSASIAIAFIAFIVLATCAALYPVRLYRPVPSR